MVPEISARRSLLEPSFRYLSPGREGEKCRPLDHMGQIPFIHSDRFLICYNFYIYTIVYQLFLPCGTKVCILQLRMCSHRKLKLWSWVIFKVIFSAQHIIEEMLINLKLFSTKVVWWTVFYPMWSPSLRTWTIIAYSSPLSVSAK